MTVRVINRWCGPLTADFGPPLGRVRIPKAGAELDINFNDLQLPKQTQAMVGRHTLEIVDLSLTAGETLKPAPKAKTEPVKPAPKPKSVQEPKPEEPGPTLDEERITELRDLAKGDERSPITKKAIEMLEAAGVPLVAPVVEPDATKTE